jgi:hypothetical protein
MKHHTFYAVILGALAACAAGSTPSLGGPMSHLLVTVFNNRVFLSFESPSMSTVTMQDNEGDFTGGASVLNGLGYNAQFGWLANGFISLPPETGIFVRSLGASPHVRVYEQTTFESILGTDGASEIWQWDGTMTHNWFATDTHGPHFALYEVFVGDTLGNPLNGYQSASIDLRFEYGPDQSHRIGVIHTDTVSTTPAPGVMSMTAVVLACFLRRGRKH